MAGEIPRAFVSVRAAKLPNFPSSIASVGGHFAGTGPTVYLIRDAHANESAQKNIARILSVLHEKADVRQVFLEAGTGDNSLTFLRRGTPELRRHVAARYLAKGWIQGPDYFDLTSDAEVRLWGVEDPALYKKGLEHYRHLRASRESVRAILVNASRTVDTLKPVVFHPRLLAFDAKRRDYLESRLSAPDYVDVLLGEAALASIPTGHFPESAKLARVKQLEASIDFRKASAEQVRALESLASDERDELMGGRQEAAGLFKTGAADRSSDVDFFAALAEKIQGRASEYPELFSYFDYLKAVSSVDAESLLAEIGILEKQIVALYASTPEEARLAQISDDLRTLDRFFDLTLSPEEFAEIEKRTDDFRFTSIAGFLNLQIMEKARFYENTLFVEPALDALFEEAASFYRLANERDPAFLKNALAQMKDGEASAIVTGGFHTRRLEKLLKEKNISYVSITPRVLAETSREKYENLLLGGGSGKGPVVDRWAVLPARQFLAPMQSGLKPVTDLIASDLDVLPAAAARMASQHRPQEFFAERIAPYAADGTTWHRLNGSVRQLLSIPQMAENIRTLVEGVHSSRAEYVLLGALPALWRAIPASGRLQNFRAGWEPLAFMMSVPMGVDVSDIVENAARFFYRLAQHGEKRVAPYAPGLAETVKVHDGVAFEVFMGYRQVVGTLNAHPDHLRQLWPAIVSLAVADPTHFIEDVASLKAKILLPVLHHRLAELRAVSPAGARLGTRQKIDADWVGDAQITSDLLMELWRSFGPDNFADMFPAEDRVPFFQYFSRFRSWRDLSAHEVKFLLLSAVDAAERGRDSGIDLINDEIIRRVFFNPKGVYELVRRAHPYTLQALLEKDQFSRHFISHEGMYYALFVDRLLGRLPDGGGVVVNVDPHDDAIYFTTKEHGPTNQDPATGAISVEGITDAGWVGAALKDGLAKSVIHLTNRKNVEIFSLDAHGEVRVAKTSFDELPKQKNAYLTIDLDTFSLQEQPKLAGYHKRPSEIRRRLRHLLLELKASGWDFRGVTTALSPDYISEKATKAWQFAVEKAIHAETEAIFNPSGARFAGRTESRIEAVLDDIRENTVLLEERLHALMESFKGAGRAGSLRRRMEKDYRHEIVEFRHSVSRDVRESGWISDEHLNDIRLGGPAKDEFEQMDAETKKLFREVWAIRDDILAAKMELRELFNEEELDDSVSADDLLAVAAEIDVRFREIEESHALVPSSQIAQKFILLLEKWEGWKGDRRQGPVRHSLKEYLYWLEKTDFKDAESVHQRLELLAKRIQTVLDSNGARLAGMTPVDLAMTFFGVAGFIGTLIFGYCMIRLARDTSKQAETTVPPADRLPDKEADRRTRAAIQWAWQETHPQDGYLQDVTRQENFRESVRRLITRYSGARGLSRVLKNMGQGVEGIGRNIEKEREVMGRTAELFAADAIQEKLGRKFVRVVEFERPLEAEEGGDADVVIEVLKGNAVGLPPGDYYVEVKHQRKNAAGWTRVIEPSQRERFIRSAPRNLKGIIWAVIGPRISVPKIDALSTGSYGSLQEYRWALLEDAVERLPEEGRTDDAVEAFLASIKGARLVGMGAEHARRLLEADYSPLTVQQKNVLRLRFGGEKPLSINETATQLEIATVRVRQLERQALERGRQFAQTFLAEREPVIRLERPDWDEPYSKLFVFRPSFRPMIESENVVTVADFIRRFGKTGAKPLRSKQAMRQIGMALSLYSYDHAIHGARLALDKDVIRPMNPDAAFLSAVGYFNEDVVTAPEMTWEHFGVKEFDYVKWFPGDKESLEKKIMAQISAGARLVNVVIREALPEDVPAIVEIYRVDYKAIMQDPVAAAELIRGSLESPTHRLFVATQEGRVVGLCEAMQVGSMGEIRMLAVRKIVQGQRIGTRLFGAAFGWLKSRSVSRYQVFDLSTEGYTGAIAAKFGFTEGLPSVWTHDLESAAARLAAPKPDFETLLKVLNDSARRVPKSAAATKILAVPELAGPFVKYADWKRAVLALERARRSKNLAIHGNAEASLLYLLDENSVSYLSGIKGVLRDDTAIRRAIHRLVKKRSSFWVLRERGMTLLGKKAFNDKSGRSALLSAALSSEPGVAQKARRFLSAPLGTKGTRLAGAEKAGSRLASDAVVDWESEGGNSGDVSVLVMANKTVHFAQSDLFDYLADISAPLRGTPDENRHQVLQQILDDQASEIFLRIARLRMAYAEMELAHNNAREYYQWIWSGSPDCGACRIVAAILGEALARHGIASRAREVSGSFYGALSEHEYLEILGEGGFFVDLAAGQFLDDFAGRAHVGSDPDAYDETIKEAIRRKHDERAKNPRLPEFRDKVFPELRRAWLEDLPIEPAFMRQSGISAARLAQKKKAAVVHDPKIFAVPERGIVTSAQASVILAAYAYRFYGYIQENSNGGSVSLKIVHPGGEKNLSIDAAFLSDHFSRMDTALTGIVDRRSENEWHVRTGYSLETKTLTISLAPKKRGARLATPKSETERVWVGKNRFNSDPSKRFETHDIRTCLGVAVKIERGGKGRDRIGLAHLFYGHRTDKKRLEAEIRSFVKKLHAVRAEKVKIVLYYSKIRQPGTFKGLAHLVKKRIEAAIPTAEVQIREENGLTTAEGFRSLATAMRVDFDGVSVRHEFPGLWAKRISWSGGFKPRALRAPARLNSEYERDLKRKAGEYAFSLADAVWKARAAAARNNKKEFAAAVEEMKRLSGKYNLFAFESSFVIYDIVSAVFTLENTGFTADDLRLEKQHLQPPLRHLALFVRMLARYAESAEPTRYYVQGAAGSKVLLPFTEKEVLKTFRDKYADRLGGDDAQILKSYAEAGLVPLEREVSVPRNKENSAIQKHIAARIRRDVRAFNSPIFYSATYGFSGKTRDRIATGDEKWSHGLAGGVDESIEEFAWAIAAHLLGRNPSIRPEDIQTLFAFYPSASDENRVRRVIVSIGEAKNAAQVSDEGAEAWASGARLTKAHRDTQSAARQKIRGIEVDLRQALTRAGGSENAEAILRRARRLANESLRSVHAGDDSYDVIRGLRSEIDAKLPKETPSSEVGSRLATVKKLPSMLLGIATAFAEERVDRRQLPVDANVFDLRVDGGRLTASQNGVKVAEQASLTVLKEETRGPSLQDIRSEMQSRTAQINASLDAAAISTEKTVIVRINLGWFDNPSFDFYLDDLIANLHTAKNQAFAKNVYFELTGDARLIERAMGREGAEELFADASSVVAKTAAHVSLSLPEMSAEGLSLSVEGLEEGQIPLFGASIRLAVALGRIDLDLIPQGFEDAFATLSGRRADKALLRDLVTGKADLETRRAFSLKPLMRVPLDRAIRFFKNMKKMLEQAA